ncbi:CHAT domain-containing protein [Rhodococcus qingshengii]|nr:CHAT domain-containing protein [Rhodococcus qingshengii]
MLTESVLPSQLRKQIGDRMRRGTPIRVRLTPSPRLARVPWELLCVGKRQRLIEIAQIVYDPPSSVHVERSCMPRNWEQVRDLPALFVIDPKLPARARAHGLTRTLDPGAEAAFKAMVDKHIAQGRALRRDKIVPVGGSVFRESLGKALRETPRSRFFYLGHVSSRPDEPGSAALHLSDTASSFGLMEPLRRIGENGEPAPAHADDHRPLGALDLLLGTLGSRQAKGKAGHEIWPMPSRVAIIACEGGADYRSVETFGLVIAIVNSGAELVTTTRWTLPTDHAFQVAVPNMPKDVRPTSTLATTVDAAHSGADPIGVLQRWQCRQLERWQQSGGLEVTPLVWASLTHTVAPERTAMGERRSPGLDRSV